jgi:uroporphyrinogen-III decarboxylase
LTGFCGFVQVARHLQADHGSYDMHVHTPVWDAKSLEDLENHAWPSPDFGDKLAFHGGVCTQRTLPFGTPDDVRREVLDRIATLGAGGGYILASSHDLSADTPPENIVVMDDPALRSR